MWNQSRIGSSVMPASARMRRSPAHPSVKAVSTVSVVRPTHASRLWRDQDFDVCLGFGNGTKKPAAHRSSRFRHCRPCTSRCTQLAVLTWLRINVESKVTATAAAAISGLVTGINPERRADLQGMSAHGLQDRFPASIGNTCFSRSAVTR